MNLLNCWSANQITARNLSDSHPLHLAEWNQSISPSNTCSKRTDRLPSSTKAVSQSLLLAPLVLSASAANWSNRLHGRTRAFPPLIQTLLMTRVPSRLGGSGWLPNWIEAREEGGGNQSRGRLADLKVDMCWFGP